MSESELRAALRRLVAAAEDYMSSDPEMPSHGSTEAEMESALESAKRLLAHQGP